MSVFAFDPERFAAHETSLSRTCAGGHGRGSAWPYLPAEQRCAVSQRVASWHSPWGFAIPTFTARSSARRRAQVQTAGRDAHFASARVPRGRHAGAVLPRERHPLGRRAARRRWGRCHDPAGGRTATRSGEKTSPGWWRGRLPADPSPERALHGAARGGKDLRVRSPQTLSEADRRAVAAWAADCAERVLPILRDGRSRR